MRIAIGLIVALAIACYANGLNSPFFFDDDASIKDNPTIRRLADLRTVLSPSSDGSGVTGRPVVNLSLAINYAIGGTAVRGYHVTNVALHTLAALALFGWVRRTLMLPFLRGRFGSASVPLGFGIAAWWATHPLQTESVTCVIQRTEVIVGLFYFLTLYSVCRSIESRSRGWRVVAVAACLVGMASKEVMVSAPLMALLYDRTFGAATFRAAWQQRRGLYLGLAATWILLGWLVLSGGGTRGSAAGLGLGVSAWSYALKQCEAIITYLKLTLWPQPLVVFYGTDVINELSAVFFRFCLLVAASLGTFYAVWRRPVVGFVGMWFFAILAPSSSIVPLVTQTVAEHRMYLPLAAPLTLLAIGAYTIAGRRALLAMALVVAGGAALSIRRNHDYRSQLSIWADTVAKVPEVAGAHLNLGAAWRATGQLERAMQHYQIAARLSPNLSEAHNNIATILLQSDRPEEAIEYCMNALRLKPKFPAAHSNLGSALTRTGRLEEGFEHLQTAVRLNPELAPAQSNLAGVHLKFGRAADALAAAQTALRFEPNLADAHTNAANALIGLGRHAEALAHMEAVLRQNPNDAHTWSNLGAVYFQLGRPQEALAPLRTAMQLKPDLIDAQNNMGSALFQIGQVAEGASYYRAAIQRNPNNPDTHSNLGLALLRLGQVPEAVAAFETALRLNPNHAGAKQHLAAAVAQRAGVAR